MNSKIDEDCSAFRFNLKTDFFSPRVNVSEIMYPCSHCDTFNSLDTIICTNCKKPIFKRKEVSELRWSFWTEPDNSFRWLKQRYSKTTSRILIAIGDILFFSLFILFFDLHIIVSDELNIVERSYFGVPFVIFAVSGLVFFIHLSNIGYDWLKQQYPKAMSHIIIGFMFLPAFSLIPLGIITGVKADYSEWGFFGYLFAMIVGGFLIGILRLVIVGFLISIWRRKSDPVVQVHFHRLKKMSEFYSEERKPFRWIMVTITLFFIFLFFATNPELSEHRQSISDHAINLPAATRVSLMRTSIERHDYYLFSASTLRDVSQSGTKGDLRGITLGFLNKVFCLDLR